MNHFVLYLILMLDRLNWFLIVSTVLSFIVFIVFLGVHLSNVKTTDIEFIKIVLWCKERVKKSFILFTVFFILSFLIPSTKQASVIYCLPKIVNAVEKSDIPEKMVDITNLWLEEQIESMKKTK